MTKFLIIFCWRHLSIILFFVARCKGDQNTNQMLQRHGVKVKGMEGGVKVKVKMKKEQDSRNWTHELHIACLKLGRKSRVQLFHITSDFPKERRLAIQGIWVQKVRGNEWQRVGCPKFLQHEQWCCGVGMLCAEE